MSIKIQNGNLIIINAPGVDPTLAPQVAPQSPLALQSQFTGPQLPALMPGVPPQDLPMAKAGQELMHGVSEFQTAFQSHPAHTKLGRKLDDGKDFPPEFNRQIDENFVKKAIGQLEKFPCTPQLDAMKDRLRGALDNGNPSVKLGAVKDAGQLLQGLSGQQPAFGGQPQILGPQQQRGDLLDPTVAGKASQYGNELGHDVSRLRSFKAQAGDNPVAKLIFDRESSALVGKGLKSLEKLPCTPQNEAMKDQLRSVMKEKDPEKKLEAVQQASQLMLTQGTPVAV
jgi:hypothetical protein